MATSAPDRDTSRRQRELDDRTRRAWSAYRESVRDLAGEEYDRVEGRSWDRLQRKLAEVERQRAELAERGPVAPG